MDFLKKRSTAFIVLAIVIVSGTLFGINRSVASLANNVEELFYNGVDGETSINVCLENRVKAAKMLVIIADNYEEIKNERDVLYNTYNDMYVAESISEKYKINQDMQKASDELYKALTTLNNVTKEQLEDAADYMDVLNNTQNKIERSSYNSKVDEFYDTISSFPVILFKFLIFADSPECFA